ncbi:MAG: PTS sugar transporter subunit IIA [Erysipelotrichaceae bacterium]|nr:PTS sugar transporter subunit IIA [Erysipelotrichaceae bacterium]MDY5252910.1 PTS sugar transporter subunit IIA [Erysipelotrichaceae bacterium]
MLKQIISKGYYRFEDGFDSWEDAVKASYEPLLENKIVENVYIDAVIDCIKKYGPYIVIIPNVAMPHSTEGAKGCHGSAISFMKVKNAVDFDPSDPEKKAILFFSLAAADHDEHLHNIQQLMETLMNEDLLADLMKADTIERLSEIAETYES